MQVQGQLFKLWEQYAAGLKSASQFHKACSTLIPDYSS